MHSYHIDTSGKKIGQKRPWRSIWVQGISFFFFGNGENIYFCWLNIKLSKYYIFNLMNQKLHTIEFIKASNCTLKVQQNCIATGLGLGGMS